MKMYKIAKMPAPPPKMVDRIMDEVNKFNDENRLQKAVDIPIDLTGWEYGGNELLDKRYEWKRNQYDAYGELGKEKSAELLGIEPDEVEEFLAKTKKKYAYILKVALYSLSAEEMPKGKARLGQPIRKKPANYNGSLGIMSILTTAPKNMLRTYIEHELIHYAQFLFRDVFGSMGFLPSKGVRDQGDAVKDYSSETETSYLLSDLEFYPFMIDIVGQLKPLLDNIDNKYEVYMDNDDSMAEVLPKIRKEKMELLVKAVQSLKPNHPLNVLKRNNIGKWKKTIVELYKYIDSYRVP